MTATSGPSDPRYLRLFGDVSLELLKKFKLFHAENPQIYEAFKRFSIEIKKSGRKHYSHWAVANRVRWHFDTEVKGGWTYKLSNDFITVLARMFVWNHPEFEGFFKLKKCKKNRKVWGDSPPSGP